MKCSACNAGSEYNRLILQRSSSELEGYLCESCERELYGGLAYLSPDWQVCTHCQNTSEVVLPLIDYLQVSESGEVEAYEFTMDELAIGVCSEHYHLLHQKISPTQTERTVEPISR